MTPGFRRGALFIVVSELMFVSSGAAVKAATASLAPEMVVFFRNLFALALLAPVIARRGVLPSLSTRVWHLHLLRALAGLGGMYCFFYALAYLPLADGMLLKMTAPIFVPLIAWAWLREEVPALVVLAVPTGFAGVVLVLDPGGAFHWAALVGIGGGVFAAWAKVTVRRLTRTEPAVRIVFFFAALAALISAVPLLFVWRMPDAGEFVLLLTVAVLATVGQLFLTRGYAAAPASRVGPFTYFAVLFAAGYGYLLWDETVDLWFAAGAALIALAGILVLHRGRGAARGAATVLPEAGGR